MSKKIKILTREEILSADDLPKEIVDCPDWGGSVYVRTLTAGERDQMEAYLLKKQGSDNIDVRALIASLCCVDEEGASIFKREDIAELSSKSVKPLDRILQAAQGLNAFSDKDIDELEKNSEGDPSEGSSFDLL